MPAPIRSKSAGRPATQPSHEWPAVQVTYYRRMKAQRVYPWVVRWSKGATPPAANRVVVRLLTAGAQVLPSEQPLASKADAQATFYVTPLARGWLKAQRLEVLLDGRKVQELPLASKVVSHRLTWFFFLMIFLGPWLVHVLLTHSPLQDLSVPQIKKEFAENSPELPAFAEPQLGDPLRQARDWTAEMVADLVHSSQHQPYAVYAALIFFGLFVAAALMKRDVRRRRVGTPVPLPSRSVATADEEEEETVR